MEIAVKNQMIVLVRDDTLIRNTKKRYSVRFIFDEAWDGYKKTALFQAGDVTMSVVLTDDKCDIPDECLESIGMMLKVLVRGVKNGVEKSTSWCKTSRILCNTAIDIPVGPSSGSHPTETGEVGRLCEDFADALKSEYTEAELKDKSLPDVIGDMDGLGNTATDEEVKVALNDVWGADPEP